MKPKKVREILGWYTKNGVHRPIYKKNEPKTAKISHITENRIKQLPKLRGSDTEVPNILNYDEQLATEANRTYQKLAAKNRLSAPVNQSVYVDTIYTSQDYLDRKKLLNYVPRSFINSEEPISGVRYKDTVILKDGNHRTALAKLRSQQKIDVEIIDLDKPKRRKWFGKKGAK